MGTSRVIIAAALTAAAALTTPAAAHPHSRVPELRATNTITAASSGYVDVLLRRAATLSPAVTGNPDLTFSGRGRMLGFWLDRIDPDLEGHGAVAAHRLPAFAGGQTRVTGTTAPRRTCKKVPHDAASLYVECDSPNPTAIVLEAGRYRLKVMTDGAPVTVGLRLRGATAGRASLRPMHALETVQKQLPKRDGVGNNVVTFGGSLELPGYSALFLVARATFSSDPVFRESSACVRREAGTRPPMEYGAHCPGGEAMSHEYGVNVAGHEHSGFFVAGTVSSNPPRTPVELGGSFADSGGVTFGDALGVAMELDW